MASEYLVKKIFSYDHHTRDEYIAERLSCDDLREWECFQLDDRGTVVVNDGTAKGREANLTVAWLRRLC